MHTGPERCVVPRDKRNRALPDGHYMAPSLAILLEAFHVNGAFECGRIYRVYEFRLGNNVRVTSQPVFTSRELVTKKAAPVSDLHLVSIIACTRSRR